MNGWAIMIERFAHALGNALVQSLWQCVLIGAIVSLGVVITRRASARYTLWCLGLLACGAWFVVTLIAGLRVEQASLGQAYTQMLADPIVGDSPIRVGVFEIIACVWACGFLVLSTRFALQWRAAWLLRTRALIPARSEWDAMYEEIRGALGVSRRVCLRVSERALCPMVVGVFVPIVLVPASVMTMLTPAQVRMVLAHELAHVRRYDHVMNMMQVIIETVMFYHPIVWWMSRQARSEREHCCDDAAVRMCGDALGYARALTELEEVRLQNRAVLGLHGGSLMKRIQRVVGAKPARRGGGGVMVLAIAVCLAGTAYAITTLPHPQSQGVEASEDVVLHEQGEAVIEIDVFVTPDGNPVSAEERDRLEAKWNTTTQEPQKKLTPMDEEYWIHQGIRPLDAYDESFADDC